MPPCQSGGISQIRHAPPLGFRHSRSRSEKCVSTRGLLWPCVSFLRMATGMAVRFSFCKPNAAKSRSFPIERRTGFAGPVRPSSFCGKAAKGVSPPLQPSTEAAAPSSGLSIQRKITKEKGRSQLEETNCSPSAGAGDGGIPAARHRLRRG